METTPLLPAWVALPVAVLTLLVLGGQFWMISGAQLDAQRRRLRQATTLVMMLLTPLAAYGFGVATPARGREYVIVWVLIAALLFTVIMLALLDMLHSLRLYRVQSASVRRRLAEERAREIAAAMAMARQAGHAGEAVRRQTVRAMRDRDPRVGDNPALTDLRTDKRSGTDDHGG